MKIGRYDPRKRQNPVSDSQSLRLSLNFSITELLQCKYGLIVTEEIKKMVELGNFHRIQFEKDSIQIGKISVQIDIHRIGSTCEPFSLSRFLQKCNWIP